MIRNLLFLGFSFLFSNLAYADCQAELEETRKICAPVERARACNKDLIEQTKRFGGASSEAGAIRAKGGECEPKGKHIQHIRIMLLLLLLFQILATPKIFPACHSLNCINFDCPCDILLSLSLTIG